MSEKLISEKRLYRRLREIVGVWIGIWCWFLFHILIPVFELKTKRELNVARDKLL